MPADIHRALAGHVVADFINHLRGGQLPLAGITAAGINERFVLAQDAAGLWTEFYFNLPAGRLEDPLYAL